ncbi:MAG: hypothetical protein HRU25_09825 [Psychrobium sp.]|nr:hypothetical protein [Psychrobium sp.]
MKIKPYHTNMVLKILPKPPLKSVGREHDETFSNHRDSTKDSEFTSKENGSAASGKLTISMAAIKKSREKPSPEDQLPPHIKRLKEQIKEIKAEIVEQQDKIAELMQSNMNDELKESTKELYLEQLASLQSSLGMASQALKKAIEDEGIEDPAVLMAAML